MSSEDTLLGNEFKMQLGSTASPPLFADFCAVYDPGKIGESKSTVDVTTLCDDAKTNRSGIADGASFDLGCNYIPGDAQVQALYASYQASENRTFRLAQKSAPTTEFFEFNATILSWELGAPIGDKATVTFGLKVSGSIDWVHA
jgi:hypothetical protein